VDVQSLKWVLQNPMKFLISKLSRRWIVDPYEYIQILAEKKIYEYTLQSKEDIRIIFVVGAYLGFEIRNLLRNYPNAIVYAFEPNPDYFSHLNRKYARSHRVFLHQIAISDSSGSTLLHSNSGHGTDSLLKLNDCAKEIYGLSPTTSTNVLSTTLDDWCREQFGNVPDVDLIWIDVQGAEGKVISGALETLSKTKAIFIEVSLFRPIGENGTLLKDIRRSLANFGLAEVALGLDSSNLTGNAIYVLQRS